MALIHLAGPRSYTDIRIDAVAAAVETNIKELHVITSGEVTAGYFTLSQTPYSASNVSVAIQGGIKQVNKQIIGATGATPDYDVLNSNELHINNNGAATGLSEIFQSGDVLIIEYTYQSL